MNTDSVLCLKNCFDIIQDNETGEWVETGVTSLIRWILPGAVIELSQEEIDKCIHYSVVVEFSARHYDWAPQKLKLGSDKELAIQEAESLVSKLAKWPLAHVKQTE